MSAEYAPGTVVVATFCGDPNVRVSRYGHGWVRLTDPDDFIQDDDRYEGGEPRVTDVRPLVVLDLPERLIGPLCAGLTYALREKGDNDLYSRRPHGEYHAVRRVLESVEAQTRPPKPAEPTGLGAVVEDADGRLFVRWSLSDDLAAWKADGYGHEVYSAIDAVRVLSEGVVA